MIGEDCDLPSAMVEEEVIQVLMPKHKSSRCENKQIEKEFGANTICPSTAAGGEANTFQFSHDENVIKRQMMKFDQSLKFLSIRKIENQR